MPKPSRPSLRAPWSATDRLVPRVMVQPLQRFVHTETAGGLVLFAAAVVALSWANSPWRAGYEQLWATEAIVEVGPLVLRDDLRHWVNDLAMALFFFVVGLEIKRELVHGELRDRRAALLPIACAVGGMVVPAVLYRAVVGSGPGSGGWGIPMATDIAFSLGLLALVGRRAPASLRAFLLGLAIVDDIGAIVVIAVFYNHGVSLWWLAGAVGGLGLVLVLQRLRVRALGVYVMIAGAVWFMTFESGVHATLAGVALGLLTPAHPFQHPQAVAGAAQETLADARRRDDIADEADESAFLELSHLARESVSPLARLERLLHPWSAMLVLPVFALANAGIEWSGLPTGDGGRVALGVGVGLLVGKPLGVVVAAVLAVRLGGAVLPQAARWSDILAVGVLAGVGFTVSLFITGLAFDGELADGAKVAVLVASVLAGAAGSLLFRLRPQTPR